MLRIIAILMLATPIWGASLVAKYNMGGVTGTITFTQTAPGTNVTITLDLDGLDTGTYNLQLREFRVNFDLTQVCGDVALGSMIGQAEVTSGKGSLVASGMDLSGPTSIEGRSFVVAGGTLKVCATIQANAEYITAFANLPAGLGGTVVFRQQEASADSDTQIYLNLYFVGSEKPTTALKWQINDGTVKMDTVATTDVADRCGNTIGSLYNPTAVVGTGCSTSSHTNCAIGSLSKKHGDVMVLSMDVTRKFYGDLSLPLSGSNSIIGKSIVFMDQSSNVFACANIVEYPQMSAKAWFSYHGTSGSISFTQRSPLDPTSIHIDLDTPVAEERRIAISEFPVPQKQQKSDPVCDTSMIDDTFNPLNVQNSPADAATTPDKYPVGDLSAKFGSFSTRLINKTMEDPTLQMFGRHSVLGRSLVIVNAQGRRSMCATIRSTLPTTTAVIRFTYPVIGYMILQQPTDMWYAETQIYVELDYGSSDSATYAHNWHIHVHPTGNDVLNSTGRCSSGGGHYNPYNVDLGGEYATHCSPYHPFRCEVGDLSKKHEQLNIRKPDGSRTKFYFNDPQLPLHGPQKVTGRSVVIHGANSAAGRLSCADVLEQKERVLRVNEWTAASGESSPSGSITFRQSCTDILACESHMKVELSSLGPVKNYHVHEYTSTSDVGALKACQGVDVGGHFNPLDGPGTGPISGTNDMYEVGDLSGKFGGMTSGIYTTNVQDLNLPLEGPLSIARRSVVIHKADGGARWACGNINDVNGWLVQAKATFEGDYVGYILLSQYHYNDGSMSPTTILMDVDRTNKTGGLVTQNHNWHVHEARKVLTDATCKSCQDHYNPFMVDMSGRYSECGPGNPLRCEVGDQSRKLGQYDIGSGKALYTDVNLNVEGTFSAAKRSFVIHADNGEAARIACANIIPYGNTSHSAFGFQTVEYTSEELEGVIAGAIGTGTADVLAVEQSRDTQCAKATIYFLGPKKRDNRDKFDDLVKSGNYQSFGKFQPDPQCTATGAAGVAQFSLHLMVLSFLLAVAGRRTLL